MLVTVDKVVEAHKVSLTEGSSFYSIIGRKKV